MADPAFVQALRSLRDCGPILVRSDHEGFITAQEHGWANAEPFGDDDGTLVFRLTEKGRYIADVMFNATV